LVIDSLFGGSILLRSASFNSGLSFRHLPCLFFCQYHRQFSFICCCLQSPYTDMDKACQVSCWYSTRQCFLKIWFLCTFSYHPRDVGFLTGGSVLHCSIGSCHSVSRFSSPQTQSWSSTVISVFPRSESVYSTFGGICGYSVRTISLSASSSLTVYICIFKNMRFKIFWK